LSKSAKGPIRFADERFGEDHKREENKGEEKENADWSFNIEFKCDDVQSGIGFRALAAFSAWRGSFNSAGERFVEHECIGFDFEQCERSRQGCAAARVA
jgi:hypothetical protein